MGNSCKKCFERRQKVYPTIRPKSNNQSDSAIFIPLEQHHYIQNLNALGFGQIGMETLSFYFKNVILIVIRLRSR